MGLKNGFPVGNAGVVKGTITGNNQSVVVDVSRAGSLMAYVTGTFAGVNVAFEGSLDGTTWWPLQVARSNSNTVESTSGALSAAPAYAWEASVNAMEFFRVRSTAFTSGTQNWVLVTAFTPTENIPAVPTHAVTQSGSWTATVTPAAGTAYSLTTTASTNLAVVRNTGASLYEITVSNPTATPAYVKLYNKASAPVVASDVPVLTLPVPANSSQSLHFGTVGKRFATGIGIGVTGLIGATDATNAVAGVQVSATYI